MQTNIAPTHTRPDARRCLRSTAALAAALLLAPAAVFGQSTTPRPAAAPRPAIAPPPGPTPTPRPGRPAPVAVEADDDDVQAPEPPEAPEAAEAPEAFELAMPDMSDLDFDLNVDVAPAMAGVQAELDAVRASVPMAVGFGRFSFGRGWQSRQRFDDVAKETDPARRAYLEGRNFVADSEWDKAAERFNEVITKYQTSKIVDSALYWYAYSLKSVSRFGDAYAALQRLITEYPLSRWNDDAKVLLAEVAGPARQPVPPEIAAEQEEQIKILALQSLFESKPDQAVELARGYFTPGSKASAKFKQRVVVMLAQVDSPAATTILVEAARGQQDPKVKRQAILMLGHRLDDKQGSDQTFALLRELASSSDVEAAKYAVLALGQDDSERSVPVLAQLATSASNTEVRKQALMMLAQRGGPQACETLIRFYDAEKDAELRKLALVMLGQSDCPQALDKLVQVARSGDTVESRRFALVSIGQRDRATAVPTLKSMYDSEKNETVRAGIIDGLGQALQESNDKEALHALVDIARRETSTDLKRKAVYWIGQSKDPEATQFLVELLK